MPRSQTRQKPQDRAPKRNAKRQGTKHPQGHQAHPAPDDAAPLTKRDTTPLRGQTEAQNDYLHAMSDSVIVFGIGPAGTGKTYCAGARGADLFADRKTEKLLLTRPAVEVGPRQGFLPGTKEEKFDPYFRPYREVLDKRLGKGLVELSIKRGSIEAAPLAYMRGWTFEDAFVVLDEAQNLTVTEMRMFLTRIGKNCTVVINGDPEQRDESVRGPCALGDAVRRLRPIAGVAVVEFSEADIVRSGIVQDIVRAYRI